MKNIIIVSKCVRISPYSSEENNYYFHFKGVFAGDLLKEVVLRGRKEFHIERGEEYLIYVQMIALEKGTLWGKILRIKPLDECWDKS
ncbi:MAG: hypothetical protein ACJ76H_04835 [Bacteriovoracaceae bacterium]